MDATETLASLASMHDLRTRADLEILRLAQHFADLFPDPATIPGHVALPGGERGHVYGGPGCPAVAEFAAAEFGAVIGRSSGSAANLMGQALALRHRLPFLWAQVEALNAEPWKACTVATACLTLSVEAAAIVDRKVAPIINSVTPRQLENIVKAAVHQADPEAARAAADQKAKERGVWAGQADEHGTTSLHIRAATGAVIRFKTTLRQIADALAQLGDTDTLPERMARAIDVISDPALTHELLTIAHHLTRSTPATPDTRSTSTAAGSTSDPDTAARPDPNPATAADSPTGPAPSTPTQHSHAGNHPGPTKSGPSAGACSWGWLADDEPGTDDEADRDPPHPSDPLNDRPPDTPAPNQPSGASGGPGTGPAVAAGPAMDRAALQELRRKVAAIRSDAYATGIGATGRRPAATTLYVHITDQTLLDGDGVARVEAFGPVFAARLEELLGHGQIIVKPVIDLKKKINVNAYETTRELREHLKLIHPVEQFPYGAAETTNSTDLDHITPYDFADTGPPGQTSIINLVPLRRYSHRVKTLGRWASERLDDGTLEWTTRHGFKFQVTHQGTRPADRP